MKFRSDDLTILLDKFKTVGLTIAAINNWMKVTIKEILKKKLTTFILFKPAVRGYMGDFLENDCILSLGLSSLGGKAAENFGLKYIIFDRSEKSQNQWKNFYVNSKLKPLFAKNIKDIERFLYEK